MLHKHQNCAIYFYNEEELRVGAEQPDIEGDLSEMNLVVIPVTTKLLMRENIAVGGILPFALEKHIPVLPLIMEGCLDEVYKKHFGSMQYLNPDSNDITAISFDEKLEKYLSGVLVGDELAQKVRDAFKAYIFMSYRKKDRKFAKELMKMIHSDDRFRDIAIWYDEYLVPGESFSEAIKDALEKSELFALVVTPNLLEEGNYVMRHEYPMAVCNNKVILPFEMDRTDREKLRERFENIPECLNKDDKEERERILLRYLAEMALEGSKDDPLHNYLIGLAYLDGIDVEVDNEKALNLIMGAAETGLPDAMKKLVSMYRDGNGVTRDYEKSAEWMEKLTGQYRTKWVSEKNFENELILVDSIWSLSEVYKELGKLKEAERCYLEMTEISSKGKIEIQDSRVLVQNVPYLIKTKFLSLVGIGDIRKRLGDLLGALESYKEAMGLSKIISGGESLEGLNYLSVCYTRMGSVKERLGDIPGAKEDYEESLIISERVAEKSKTLYSRLNLSKGLGMVGDVIIKLGKLTETSGYYEKGLKIAKEIAEEKDSFENIRNVSVFYCRIGHLKKLLGDIKGAMESYEESINIRKTLAAKYKTIQSLIDLSGNYNSIGGVKEIQGDFKGALDCFEKALEINKSLMGKEVTYENRLALLVSYERIGKIKKIFGDIKGAGDCFEECIRIANELISVSNSLESKRALSVNMINMGDVKVLMGDKKDALSYYETALIIRKELAKESRTLSGLHDLIVNYGTIGDLKKDLGDTEGAIKYYLESKKLSEEAYRSAKTNETIRDLSVSYGKITEIKESSNDLEGAKEYADESIRIIKEASDATDDLMIQEILMIGYYKAGMIRKRLGELIAARDYCEMAVKTVQNIDCKKENIRLLRIISKIYLDLGFITKDSGDLKKTRSCYEESLKISERVIEEKESIDNYRDLSVIYWSLGEVERSMNEKEKALNYYEIFLKTAQKINDDQLISIAQKGIKSLTDSNGVTVQDHKGADDTDGFDLMESIIASAEEDVEKKNYESACNKILRAGQLLDTARDIWESAKEKLRDFIESDYAVCKLLWMISTDTVDDDEIMHSMGSVEKRLPQLESVIKSGIKAEAWYIRGEGALGLAYSYTGHPLKGAKYISKALKRKKRLEKGKSIF